MLRGLGLSEESIKNAPVVGQKGAPQMFVAKEAMIQALKQDATVMLEELVDWEKDIPRPAVEDITGHSLRRSGAKDAVRKHHMPLSMVQWLGRWGSDAVKGYVEEALEELPEAEVQMTTWQGLTEKALSMRSKTQKLERDFEALKATVKGEQEATQAMIEEVKKASKPPMVIYLASMTLHATAHSQSAEWKENPMVWVTRCGLWRWASAGRLARTVTTREQSKESLVVCTKCRQHLLDEGLLLED